MEEIAESPPIPAKLWFPFCILWCIIRDNIHSGGLSALASHAPAQTNLDHNDGGTPIMITRTVAREIAVHYAFELGFSNLSAQELLEQELTQERFGEIAEIDPLYAEFPDEKQCAYIRKLVEGVGEHGYELDEYISKYAIGWKFQRIPRIAAAIMRVAMYEVLYMPEIPASAAINAAVELAKKYDEPKVASFVNGILGSFVRKELPGGDQA